MTKRTALAEARISTQDMVMALTQIENRLREHGCLDPLMEADLKSSKKALGCLSTAIAGCLIEETKVGKS